MAWPWRHGNCLTFCGGGWGGHFLCGKHGQDKDNDKDNDNDNDKDKDKENDNDKDKDKDISFFSQEGNACGRGEKRKAAPLLGFGWKKG